MIKLIIACGLSLTLLSRCGLTIAQTAKFQSANKSDKEKNGNTKPQVGIIWKSIGNPIDTTIQAKNTHTPSSQSDEKSQYNFYLSEKREGMSPGEIWICILTGFLVIGTFYLGYHTKNLVEDSRKQTALTTESLALTRRTVDATNRAYIAINELKVIDFMAGSVFKIIFNATNRGTLPANNFGARVAIFIRTTEEECIIEMEGDILEKNYPIPVNGINTCESPFTDAPVTEIQEKEVYSGEKSIFVCIDIGYSDPFHTDLNNRFFGQYIFAEKRFRKCKTNNY